MLRFYSAQEVHEALPFPRLAAALERAFARGATVPLRHAHRLDESDVLLLMPAWRNPEAGGERGALGVKVVTVFPGAAARGAPTVAALYVLLDRETGAARAVLDGEALTFRRTAAVSALAARFLARADSRVLLVVGTGKLAPYLLRAHVALRPRIERVLVWGRSSAKAEAMAARLRGEGLAAVQAVDDLEPAVRQADIVSCATTATEPVVAGRWLAPGAHLDLVGAFTRTMREADDEAVAGAHIVVDTYVGALAEAGDIIVPLERGLITRAQIGAELGQLARGERPGRASDGQVTLFKSVGTALGDLAAAELVAESSG